VFAEFLSFWQWLQNSGKLEHLRHQQILIQDLMIAIQHFNIPRQPADVTLNSPFPVLNGIRKYVGVT
jgi:hypothetical protein